jgi:hypothetical protein
VSIRPVKLFHQESHLHFVAENQIEWTSVNDLWARAEIHSRDFANRNKPSAFVFDLDSTLFCTAPRLKKIFQKFLLSQENPEKAWIQVLGDMSSGLQRYSVPETFFSLLLRYRERKEAEIMTRALWENFEDFWKKEFFLSTNIVSDPPYEGAAEFVHRIYALGYEIVYLTGRDAGRGLDGTAHTLRRWQFPRDPLRTHMILKPDRDARDLEFKRKVADVLRSRFEVDFVIDNEPENLVMFAEKIPKAEIIFFHSIMSRRKPSRPLAEVLGSRRLQGLKSFDLTRTAE